MQYKNANIVNFILALPIKINYSNKHVTLKYNPHVPLDFLFHIYQQQLEQIKKKTANLWECKVGNNANIANFVWLWKKRLKNNPKFRSQWLKQNVDIFMFDILLILLKKLFCENKVYILLKI